MILKSEIKRFLFNPLLSVLLIISICWQLNAVRTIFEPELYTYQHINNYDLNEYGKIEIESNITNSLNSYDVWLSTFVPYISIIALISCLPYAATYIIDKKSGYLKNILMRSKKDNYFFSKTLLNALSGGLIVSLSSKVTLIILLITLTNEIPSILSSSLYINEPAIFINYLFENTIIYIFFVFSLMFFIGATFSTFALTIGMFTKNIILSILIPQIYMLVGGSICSTLGLNKINPWNVMYFNFEQTEFKFGLLNISIIMIVSLILIYIKSREDVI